MNRQSNRGNNQAGRTSGRRLARIVLLIVCGMGLAGCGQRTISFDPFDQLAYLSIKGKVSAAAPDASSRPAVDGAVVMVRLVEDDAGESRKWTDTTDAEGCFEVKVKWFRYASYRITAMHDASLDLTADDINKNYLESIEMVLTEDNCSNLDLTLRMTEEVAGDQTGGTGDEPEPGEG